MPVTTTRLIETSSLRLIRVSGPPLNVRAAGLEQTDPQILRLDRWCVAVGLQPAVGDAEDELAT